MGRFTRIPSDTFEQLQTDAGILLYNFNLETEGFSEDDIICPTTGGINASCVPTFSDMGEDVDNCPANMMELMHLDSWACTLSFTSLGTSPRSIRLALGCADIDSENPTKIVPRMGLDQKDFSNVWWVGDRADGGMVAVLLKNALSTSGFSLQTTKAGKGNTSVTLTGHVSIDAQAVVPMEFYSAPPLPKSEAAAVPPQTSTLLGKSISEMVSSDTIITDDGSVVGTIRYIESFPEFSSKKEEQSGNYFPLTLTKPGSTMSLYKNGTATKEDMPFDKDIVLRVTSEDDVFAVEVDDVAVLTLNFKRALLQK